jgi:CheY-like chemotaxis protein
VTGDFIELAVEDTGHGIDPAVLERIFDPFFTTKIGGKGTGMGLSTTHGIVHDYGGHIIVDTARGRGTVFRVLLPYPETTAAAPAPEPARITVRSAPELSGSVLLVDDDPQVLEFMHELLTDWGLDVHAFGDPLAALRSVSRGDAVFDLAILDQTMPALSGLQLARRLAELRPDPRILIYTGYSDPISDEEVEQSSISALLHKPIDNEHLLAVLRENLPD